MSKQRKKKKPISGANISIYIDRKKLRCLDIFAGVIGLRRSGLIQHILEGALEEMLILEKADVIRTSFVIARLSKQWSTMLDEAYGIIDRDRQKKDSHGVNISVWLNQDLIDDLEKLAPKLDMSRSKLIDTVLEVGLREIESFQVKKTLPQGYVLGMLKAQLNKSWRMTFARSQGALEDGEILIKRISPAEKAY